MIKFRLKSFSEEKKDSDKKTLKKLGYGAASIGFVQGASSLIRKSKNFKIESEKLNKKLEDLSDKKINPSETTTHFAKRIAKSDKLIHKIGKRTGKYGGAGTFALGAALGAHSENKDENTKKLDKKILAAGTAAIIAPALISKGIKSKKTIKLLKKAKANPEEMAKTRIHLGADNMVTIANAGEQALSGVAGYISGKKIKSKLNKDKENG